MATYPFETASLFLADFAVTATITGSSPAITAQVILSEPGQDLLGSEVASTQYEIEYITAQLSLGYGTPLTIGSQSFTVLQAYPLSDGTFSRARLQT